MLALPYYRAHKLVDVRYLHISAGQLKGSWLAAEACAPYMLEQHFRRDMAPAAAPQQQQQDHGMQQAEQPQEGWGVVEVGMSCKLDSPARLVSAG